MYIGHQPVVPALLAARETPTQCPGYPGCGQQHPLTGTAVTGWGTSPSRLPCLQPPFLERPRSASFVSKC